MRKMLAKGAFLAGMFLATGVQAATECRASWMSGGYGVMVHWLFAEPTNVVEVTDSFDLAGFMADFEASGAKWLIFPFGQNRGAYAAPSATLRKYCGDKVGLPNRDLVGEIAKAVHARGKRFVAYLPIEVRGNPLKTLVKWDEGDPARTEFQQVWTAVIREWALRYGELIDGWWLDGYYGKEDWSATWSEPIDEELWASALRAGNPKAAVAINNGEIEAVDKPERHVARIVPRAKRLPDFLAGELFYVDDGKCCVSPRKSVYWMPKGRYAEGTRVLNHVLFPIDGHWGLYWPWPKYMKSPFLKARPEMRDAAALKAMEARGETPAPVVSREGLQRFIRDFTAVGGGVTVNIGIDRKGRMNPKSLAILPAGLVPAGGMRTRAWRPKERWCGFNLVGMFSHGAWKKGSKDIPGRFPEDHFQWMREWGFNFARLPLDYRFLVEKGDWMKPAESGLAKLDEAIRFGRRHGVHVQINLHRAPGYCCNKPEEPKSLFRDPEPLAAFTNLWSVLARRYHGIPNEELSFDLVNEPAPISFYGITPSNYAVVAKAAFAAIRAADPDRFTMSDGWRWGMEPVMELHPFDAASGEAIHCYDPHAITHYRVFKETEEPCPPWPPAGWTNGVEWLEENFVKPWKPAIGDGTFLFAGELGCYQGTVPHATYLAWLEDILTVCDRHGWGWAMWNLDGGFGILDTPRKDCAFEDFHGHKLDRAALDILLRHRSATHGASRVVSLGPSAAANRAAIQAAVDSVSRAGGGRVVVPAGVWPCGTIWLKDHVELHLEKGATILGSTKAADYNANDVFPENFWSNGEEWSGGHLVLAYKATDVAITGEGTIDGNGPAFFGECDYDSWFPGYKYGLKLHPKDRTWYRPGPMVAMFLTKGIRMEGVTLKNTPCWTCHLHCCDGVDIRNVTIDADRTIANSDGFSIDCTRNVVVRGCTVRTGDDGFAIRASCGRHAATNACENLLIEDCDVWSCCFGIRYGIGTGLIRNVEVRNCRFHESTCSFGLTPAWVSSGKSVHFGNLRHFNCTGDQCERPVYAPRDDNTRFEDILFENCDFASLLPVRMGASASAFYTNVVFRNCSRRTLDKIDVRYNLRWHNEHPDRSRAFADFWGGMENIAKLEGCRPNATFEGALLLSFDDRNFEGWRKAEPLFAKYGAHATFFVSGPIDSAAVAAMKHLAERGHSVGLHGLRHANADAEIAEKGSDRYYDEDIRLQYENCRVCYVPVKSFAYPNCRFSAASDDLFRSKGWAKRVRGGVKGATPYDPKGEKQKDRKPLVTNDAVFVPADEIASRYRLDTIIVGEAYQTDIDEILSCLKRAKERREVISITSHDIAPDAKHIHMKTAWLEKILVRAKELDLPVIGFNELPPVVRR